MIAGGQHVASCNVPWWNVQFGSSLLRQLKNLLTLEVLEML